MLQNVVRLAVGMTVNEGQMDAFTKLASQMTAGAASEPGTLGYEWFFGADGRRCRLLETYVNADAVAAHFAGPVVQQMVPQLVRLCKVEAFEIYGDPGPQVSQTATALGAQIYRYWLGINR